MDTGQGFEVDPTQITWGYTTHPMFPLKKIEKNKPYVAKIEEKLRTFAKRSQYIQDELDKQVPIGKYLMKDGPLRGKIVYIECNCVKRWSVLDVESIAIEKTSDGKRKYWDYKQLFVFLLQCLKPLLFNDLDQVKKDLDSLPNEVMLQNLSLKGSFYYGSFEGQGYAIHPSWIETRVE